MTPEERLKQVKHIVVLMMENRSFDHMLGYLTKAGMKDVRGLKGDESNFDEQGVEHRVHAFDTRKTDVQRAGEALKKGLDPDHSKSGVKIQIGPADGPGGFKMDGFVKDYVASRKNEQGKPDTDFPPSLWNVPMGYYEGKDLPVYDHLARTFAVCDAWHSSIPGDTWPNRQYAVAGRAGPSVWKTESDPLWNLLKNAPLFKEIKSLPVFNVPAFTRHLHDKDWRWYSHDPATLRLVDSEYRDFQNRRQDNFAWFNRKQMSLPARIAEERVARIVARDSFLDDAANGGLRKVSWIDPNFVDASVLDPNSNDDHPPSDVLAGQQLVFDVYEALIKSPEWDDTVLVITYDEHGGFYDHVGPPAVLDDSGCDTLGVRVPALIVGPRVPQTVIHEASGGEAWDHTALIRSILMAFADDPQEAINRMGGRVRERTAHLGMMLADQPRKLPPEDPDLKRRLRHWREDARGYRSARAVPDERHGRRSKAPDGVAQPLVLTEFQTDWVQAALAMREAGLTTGT